MALPELYEQITWHNGTTPALNEDNLNAMSQAIKDIDDRVIEIASTVMEDVPQIIEDMEILEPAIESIDENVARAEAAADSAEQYAEEIAPPIRVVKDFAGVQALTDALDKNAVDVKIKITPKQDLHGYPNPWVGGAGKNRLPLTVARIKALNTSGTWSGNSYIVNGITFAVQTDADGNITGIKCTGTASADATVKLANGISATAGQVLSGCPSNGGVSTYFLAFEQADSPWAQYARDFGSGATISTTTSSDNVVYMRIRNGYAIPSSGLLYQPMISASGGAYEPYTNICPITGFTEAKVTRTGKNLLNNQASTSTVQGIKYTVNSDKSITIANTATAQSVLTLSANDNSLPAGTYIYSKGSTNANVYCNINAKKNNAFVRNIISFYAVSEQSFTLDYNGYDSIDILIYVPSGKAPNTTIYPMIRSATIADATYEPYTGTTYTIDLNGTRYGGTLDVTSGVLTVTKGYKVYDGSSDENWWVNSHRFLVALPSDCIDSTSEINLMCNQYEPKSTDTMWSNRETAGFVGIGCRTTQAIIVDNVHYSNYDSTDLANFKTFLASNPLQIVYELATPQTIQLTATEVALLYAYNVLWADTGDLALTYDASGVLRIANSKLDIDTFKSIVASSSDFADFKSKVAAL